MILIDFDKAGAEWVIVAYMAGDANMIAAIESGISPHVQTAHLMSGASYDLIQKEDKLLGQATDSVLIEDTRREQYPDILKLPWYPRSMTLRQAGKKANHSLNYDEGPGVYAMLNEIDLGEARKHIILYHTAYPNIRTVYHTDIKSQIARDRIVSTPTGAKQRFLGAVENELYKSAYAWPPQSTVFSMVRDAMIALYNSPDKHLQKAQQLAQIHDSLTIQYPIPTKDWKPLAQTIHWIVKAMTPTLTWKGRSFHVKTDIKIGNRWGHAMKSVRLVESVAEQGKLLKEVWNEQQAKEAA